MTVASKVNFLINNLTIRLWVGLLISSASLYASSVNAAAIYKVVDHKTGQVTFTDNLRSYQQQANQQISQTNITTGPASAAATDTSRSGKARIRAQLAPKLQDLPVGAVRTHYQLTMIEPSEERAYRRPAQNILLNLQLQPALQIGDSVNIYLDNDLVAQGLKAAIATVDILPGEHKLKAVVNNKQGQILQQVSRTVYVIQNNVAIPDNKKVNLIAIN